MPRPFQARRTGVEAARRAPSRTISSINDPALAAAHNIQECTGLLAIANVAKGLGSRAVAPPRRSHMKRLYLHIGTHKTGTTSVQRFLNSNREQLRRQGLVYPNTSISGFKRHYAHHQIAHAMAQPPDAGRPDAGTPDDARRFFDAVRDDLAAGEAGVISAEAMYRHVLPPPPGVEDTRAFDGGARTKGDPLRYIRTVRDCIGDFDVTILVMLRRQDLFMESLYAESVMSSNYQADIDEFIRQRGWLADYYERLRMWEDVFGTGSISMRVFEPRSFGMPLERYFVEWLGGTWNSALKPAMRYNVTVPRSLVEYKRALNGRQPRSVLAQYRRWLEDLASATGDDRLPHLSPHYLTHRVRIELMERFEEGNRLTAEHFLGRQPLFAEITNDSSEHEDPDRLSGGAFRDVTRLLLRHLAQGS
jgi:hypothetical protein